MALASPKSLDPGTGGGSVQPVTPPAAASESVASGGSLADVTFSAFTDPGSRIASYTATKTNVSGSATISGSGLGPYAISGEADGEVITIELDAKDSGGDVLATAVYTGTVGASGGASWTDVYDLDLTTDITDLTLTIDGGDTTLYEADGTTVKATVYAETRIGSPSTESAVITSAAGGFEMQCGGASDANIGGVKIDTDALGIDFDDPQTAVAVYVVVSGYTLPTNTNSIAVGIGPDTNIRIGGAATWLLQQRRDSPTSYIRRGVQSISGTTTNDTDQDSQTSVRSALVSCFFIKGGRSCDAISVVGTTIPDGVPDVTGTTITAKLNYTDTIGTGSPFTTQLCAGIDLVSSDANVTQATIERVVIRTLDLS